MFRTITTKAQTLKMLTRSQTASFSVASEPLDVVHDQKNRKFFIELHSHEAILSYTKKGNTLVLEHTVVPEVFQGKGVGKILAKVRFEK